MWKKVLCFTARGEIYEKKTDLDFKFLASLISSIKLTSPSPPEIILIFLTRTTRLFIVLGDFVSVLVRCLKRESKEKWRKKRLAWVTEFWKLA